MVVLVQEAFSGKVCNSSSAMSICTDDTNIGTSDTQTGTTVVLCAFNLL